MEQRDTHTHQRTTSEFTRNETYMWGADAARIHAREDESADQINYAAALTYAASREWL